MLHSDLALARRLEIGDASGNAELIAALRRLRPEGDAAAEPIAGGYALYAGTDSPLTQVIGLGMAEPVTVADIDRLRNWYSGFGAPVHIEVCPLADRTLHALLGDYGFRIEEHNNVLARRVGASVAHSLEVSGVKVQGIAPDEADLWSKTVTEGFGGDDNLTDLFLAVCDMPASTCFLATVDGIPAGGGAVAVREGIAALFGTSTRPVFRNRGVQSALIGARLALAAEHGCDTAMVMTHPGSGSQRNVERHGFQVLYTRSKMRLEQENA